MMPAQTAPAPPQTWAEANRACLEAELERLRLLLHRRVLWLRRQWQHDPLQSYQGLVISEAQADWLLAGEDRQAEQRFYAEDPEAAEITRAIHRLEADLAAQAKALTAAGAPPALEMLVLLFRLTPFERDVLLLCLAPEVDPAFERLYAYVHDDVTRKYATPHLALTLTPLPSPCGGGTGGGVFLPEAPLRRYRLASLEPGPLPATTQGACPLRLDARVADYLLGVNRLDERVALVMRPAPPAPLLTAPQADLLTRLQRLVEADAGHRPLPMLNLIGPSGAGKRAIARALCDQLGLALYALDVTRLPSPGPERWEMVRLLEREALLLPAAFYLDATDVDSGDRDDVTAVRRLMEDLRVFLIVGSRERWQTEREMVAVRVPKPDASARRALWQQALTGVGHSLDGQVEAMAQQFDFGATAIAQVMAAAQGRARLRAPDACTERSRSDGAGLTADDLWQACREQAGWGLDELAQRIIPCYAWEDIVLPDDTMRQLREIAAQVAHRHQVYEGWGFGAKLSRGRGISALFAGPSGTGKTMAAEILTHHLRLDLYRIDLSGVVSKYIGETEKNLRKVFDAAEASGAILFFDEADALFGKRSEVKDSHDRYANIEINYLLQRMEDYRGLAILATNMKSLLDQAFLRRLRFLVDFPFPDASLRLRIWQKVFPPQAAVDGLDYTFLARLEIAGGNIKNIALNAAFLAADEGVPIGMGHVMQAARREYAKIGKLVLESEFGPYYAMVKR